MRGYVCVSSVDPAWVTLSNYSFLSASVIMSSFSSCPPLFPVPPCGSILLVLNLEEFVKMQSSCQGIKKTLRVELAWLLPPASVAPSTGLVAPQVFSALGLVLPEPLPSWAFPSCIPGHGVWASFGAWLDFVMKNSQSGAWLFGVPTMRLCLASSPLKLLSWVLLPLLLAPRPFDPRGWTC